MEQDGDQTSSNTVRRNMLDNGARVTDIEKPNGEMTPRKHINPTGYAGYF